METEPMTSRFLRAAMASALVLVAASCVVPAAPQNEFFGSSRVTRIADSTVEYSPGLAADLYLPRSGGNRGVIVLVHAGGFYSGSRAEMALYSDVILDQVNRGFSVVNIDYRLTYGTENHFPAAVADVSAAIDWVRADGRVNGLNPDKILVAGHSAGGTLAALIGLGANNPGSPRGVTSPVDGWIAISGIYDMRGSGIGEVQSRIWLGPAASAATIDSASAVTLADSNDPPGYIAHGAKDAVVPLAQSVQFAGAVSATGVQPWLDIVSEPACDGHIPTCAMNTVFLNIWIDGIVP